MKMTGLMIVGCVLFATGCASSQGDELEAQHASAISVGTDIDIALERMRGYSDGGPLLAMGSRNRDIRLKQWPVDEGVMIAGYSVTTNKITSLAYFLFDERPKAERMHFDFEVISFDPSSRRLVLTTKTPEEVVDEELMLGF
ncbi:hypothetical protein OT109_14665 [Phycisphaeraceae bacterium D3-23]